MPEFDAEKFILDLIGKKKRQMIEKYEWSYLSEFICVIPQKFKPHVLDEIERIFPYGRCRDMIRMSGGAARVTLSKWHIYFSDVEKIQYGVFGFEEGPLYNP